MLHMLTALLLVLTIDKGKIETYLRYAEGFNPSLKVAVEDPVPAAQPGLYRVLVHLSMGQQKQDKTYFLTDDGKRLLSGPVWDLTASPFIETAARLPKDGPSFGPPDAPVTLVVFSDFQCPYCREFAKTLRENLPQKYPKEVRVVFEDFPIESIHPWARGAAEAGHCVGTIKPEAFWSFHDWIFEHQGEITTANLRAQVLAYAKDHGVPDEPVAHCLDAHASAALVNAGIEKGHQLEIQQTPTFFLNGRMVNGALPWPSLNTLIEMELKRPSFIPPASGTK